MIFVNLELLLFSYSIFYFAFLMF